MSVQHMAAIAAECVREPGRASIWSERHGRYVCEKDPYFPPAKAEGAN
jgi:hypothetical protein